MNYLFWNTGKNKINSILAQIINHYSCDIIGLAEYTDDIGDLIQTLNTSYGLHYHHIPQIGCKRIEIITTINTGNVKHLPDSSYYAIKSFPHNTIGNHIIAFVHMPSKLHKDELDQHEDIRRLRYDIEAIEESEKNTNTIIVGDFNVNPFENSMVSAGSIHSVPNKIISAKTRTISGIKHSMFYNPMWNLLGDHNKIPGTYYYNNSHNVCFHWNIFDQVIVRPSLVNNLDASSIKIINSINDINLFNKSGYPNKTISDHFPIFFKIN